MKPPQNSSAQRKQDQTTAPPQKELQRPLQITNIKAPAPNTSPPYNKVIQPNGGNKS